MKWPTPAEYKRRTRINEIVQSYFIRDTPVVECTPLCDEDGGTEQVDWSGLVNAIEWEWGLCFTDDDTDRDWKVVEDIYRTVEGRLAPSSERRRSMVAGRELDTLVAEKVMGWTVIDRKAMGWMKGPVVWSTGNDMVPTYQDFRPSTNMFAAWEVWERLIADGWYPDLKTTFSHEAKSLIYICELHRGGPGIEDHVSVQGYTAQYAICEAALVGVASLPTEGG